MDLRLQIERMTEGGFFIEAIHFYHFIGRCLIENIQLFTIYVSWKFLLWVPPSEAGRTVQLLFHFLPPFLYSLPYGFFYHSARPCHSHNIHPFIFPEWVLAHSALSLESLAMMKPNRVQNA